MINTSSIVAIIVGIITVVVSVIQTPFSWNFFSVEKISFSWNLLIFNNNNNNLLRKLNKNYYTLTIVKAWGVAIALWSVVWFWTEISANLGISSSLSDNSKNGL